MNLVVDGGGLQGSGAGRGLGQETTEVPASHGGKHPDDPGEPGPGVEADPGEVALEIWPISERTGVAGSGLL